MLRLQVATLAKGLPDENLNNSNAKRADWAARCGF